MVAALDALRELDLLRRGEQVDLADVLEEELERVGRDLAGGRDLLRLCLLGARCRTTSIWASSSATKNSSSCAGVQIELVKRERDLLGRQRAVFLRAASRLRASSVSRMSDGREPAPLATHRPPSDNAFLT